MNEYMKSEVTSSSLKKKIQQNKTKANVIISKLIHKSKKLNIIKKKNNTFLCRSSREQLNTEEQNGRSAVPLFS